MKNEPKNLYNSNVTYSNMTELLIDLRKKQEVETLLKENSLSPNLLRSFFQYAMKGFNNAEIAQKIGKHRITIQRYSATLRKMKESDFQKIHKYLMGDEYNEANGN